MEELSVGDIPWYLWAQLSLRLLFLSHEIMNFVCALLGGLKLRVFSSQFSKSSLMWL